jgi:hypothetical protein
MKIMARHSSATPHEEKLTTPEETLTRHQETTLREETSTTPDRTPTRREETSTLRERESDNINSPLKSHIIDGSLKRRARLLISNSSIPRQTRSLIRYALEIKDPYLAQVVRRVEGGEMNIECLYRE